MGITFDYEENPHISEADMEEFKKRISLSENSITNKAPRFLEYLDQSGLPEDRKAFWMERIVSPDFKEEDEQAFEDEMQAHIEGLETNIDFLEFENKALEEKKKRLLEKAGPSIQTMAKEAPALLEAEFKGYKSDVLDAEKSANDEIEGLRSSKESEEMEAIRKRLGKD